MENLAGSGAPSIPAAQPRHRRRVLRWGIPALALALVAGGLVALIIALQPSSTPPPLTRDVLAYAKGAMEWQSGPSVQRLEVIPLRDLERALSRSVPTHVRTDVNVADLIRRFGANRRVAFAVLTGTYNSLPPDEGVVVHGDAVVLVDPGTDKGLYINN